MYIKIINLRVKFLKNIYIKIMFIIGNINLKVLNISLIYIYIVI